MMQGIKIFMDVSIQAQLKNGEEKNVEKRYLATFSPLFLHFLFFVGFCHLTSHLKAFSAS